VVVAYDSMMVTREETPDSLYGLFKQRTRWNQGFLQVLAKGEWKRLPTVWQRLLARYTLISPFLQAFTGIAIPIGIFVALFVDAPVAVALITFLPVLPTLTTLAFEVAGLHDFGAEYGLRITPMHYLKLIVGAPLYMLVLAAASLRAVWRERTGRSNWELTRHVGAHLSPPASSLTAKEETAA
jgi:cellulose synthase/poly-beta-1,6-N-acetylglucosamine synthase-like glycosyltransferase